MIPLKYLLEARLRLGQLQITLDEFKEFVKCAVEYDDEAPVFKQIENKVIAIYDEQTWRTFLGWVETCGYISEPGDLYATLERFPLDRLERLLGSGSFASALQYGDDKVIKWYHPGQGPEKTEKVFLQYCLNSNPILFPKAYKVTRRFVVLERLDVKTPKAVQYVDIINKTKYNGTSLYLLANKVLGGEVFTPDDKDLEAWNWYLGALREAKENGFIAADLSYNNVGEREDGTIIWFDI